MAVVVITEPMAAEGIEVLRSGHEVRFDPSLADDRSRLFVAAWEAEALVVRNRTRVDAELLAMAPGLRVVGRLGTGLDNLDLEACRSRGVEVRSAPGLNAVSVAEHVIGALLVLLRPALRSTERVLAGEWPRTEMIGAELSGRRLGLLGLGATAREVADRAMALGMDVAASDPFADAVPEGVRMLDLDHLLGRSDAVSVHVPLTPQTEGLLDDARLALLPEGAVVVDTSRGGVVDHPAVLAALRGGWLGGAALDVFPTEPLTAEAAEAYRDTPNLVLTPHVAGITAESDRRISVAVAEAVAEVLGR